ncbi:MAG: CCA tRNA nucleotidyltransferase [Firmicutes bacterium]|nr:CCA tRNA nucleotidyltransferase [Bacillota bacterium]
MTKVKEVAQAIAQAGGQSYFVGGFVRDYLLDRPSHDIDVEVFHLEPHRLYHILSRFGQVKKVGKAFSIFLVKGEGLNNIDFSLPQGPPHESVWRRDFTMNALLMDVLTGEIYDYVNGREDIKQKILRHVSENVFRDDPLRILRAIQLAARLEFTIHQDTLKLMAKDLFLLHTIPRERVYGEFKKLLLQAAKPSVGLRYLQKIGGLELFPELQAMVNCPQPPNHHPEGDVWEHTLLVVDEAAKLRPQAKYPEGLMWAALCHDLGKPATYKAENSIITFHGHAAVGAELAQKFMQRFTKEKKLIDYVTTMVKEHMSPFFLYKNNATDAAVRRLAVRIDLDELLLLVRADDAGRGLGTKPRIDDMLAWLAEKKEKLSLPKITPLLKGRHLLEMGLEPGPLFGTILKEAFAMQLDGADFPQIYQTIKNKYAPKQQK